MKQSDSIAKLAAALVAAQGELKAIAKDARNPHFNSSFASLGAIIEEVRPVLARHQLSVVQGATLPESDANAKVTGFTVETMLIHESGEWLLATLPIPLAKQDPQGAGAAMTYGRRYGLSALLSLNTDEDDDGNAASRPAKAKRSEGKSEGRAGASGAAGTTQPPATAQAQPIDQRKFLPFGKSKGTPLADMKIDDLVGAVTWAKENKAEHYKLFIESAEAVLEDKRLGV